MPGALVDSSVVLLTRDPDRVRSAYPTLSLLPVE